MDNQFAADVREGLTAINKHISSKYFYDRRGDELFQQIMGLEEYYPTRSEYEILDTYKERIHHICSCDGKFRLIELGAGDGYKTKVLLRYFLKQGSEFEYVPVDISPNALSLLENTFLEEFPTLNISPVCGDYFRVLEDLKENSNMKSTVLFLGSNIGNFSEVDRNSFLSSMAKNLKRDDVVLIGFDLKKDPNIILSAYNDMHGVTRDFNLNLLHRMNNQLGANFDVNEFIHYPTYNPISGKAESHLLSKIEQTVAFKKLDLVIEFQKWEPIHLEISRKFSSLELDDMAELNSFEPIDHLSDSNDYFMDVLWRVR